MEKTVVELFAGVGGFRCGLNHVTLENGEVHEDDTWNFVYANQYEPSTKTQAAFDCYTERFGINKNHTNIDIACVDKNDIPDHTLLVGGFPCQDYSVARTLSNEKGIEGKKGVLWWEIVQVIELKKPSFVLLENVDRLLRSPSIQRGKDFGIMLRTFYDNGYDVEWRVINASEYGFPQKRRRIFIFAYHNATKYYKKMSKINDYDLIYNDGLFAQAFPLKPKILDKNRGYINGNKYPTILEVNDKFKLHFFNSGRLKDGYIYTVKTEPDSECSTTLNDILEKNGVDDKYFLEDEKLEKFEYLKGKKKLKRTRNGKTYFYSEGAIPYPEKTDVPARTMLTSEGSVNRSSHVIRDPKNGKYRILTPIECERINMFPDNWTDIDSKSMTERRRYFMMGNALVVGIVERLSKYLEDIVNQEN